MDTLTVPQVASQLGVSIPTVHRLLDRFGVPHPGRGRPRPITPDQIDKLRDLVGATPDLPSGLDRVQLLVLAALSRAALGLESERAVARAAGVSPSAAGKALDTLLRAGLVARQSRKVVRGVPTTVEFWLTTPEADRDPRLRRAIKTARTPVKSASSAQAKRVPRRFAHLFWNADLALLDPRRDGAYIAGRLLDKGDIDALVWALENITSDDLRNAAAVRGLDPRVRRFVSNALEPRR